MERNLLPIGSVVLLKEGNKRLMICGRIQTKDGEDTIYDYSACMYPEGIVDPSSMFFFNNDAIETVFFLGFQDSEGMAYTEALNQLGELEIRDGEIIEVVLVKEESEG